MDLNDNIKSIIYNYYTYTDKQIELFHKDWQKEMNQVNKFFNVSMKDYLELCFVCKEKDHFNRECPLFYTHLHIINTILNND